MDDGHVGVVVALEGDTAIVRFERSSMCSHCRGCLAIGDREMETRITNALHANVGDKVIVAMQAKKLVSASIFAYAIPLIAFLCGVYVGSLLSDIAAIAFGLVGCSIAYIMLRGIDRRLQRNQAFRPIMISVQTKEEE